MSKISSSDYCTIVIYLLGIVLLGLYYGRKTNKTSTGYFFAGNSLKWPVIGASLFAANISTVHLVGLAESGYVDGIVWGNFEWFSSFELILLALIFIPFYLRTKIKTLPAFLAIRYDERSRTLLAIFSVLSALFMHIGVSMYAGAIVFNEIFGLDIFVSVLIIAISTGIYTIVGGLNSVVITETLQTIILIIGALTLTVLAIMKLPQINIYSLTDLRNALNSDHLSAVSFNAEKTGFTFFDILLGHLVLGIWYWCTDQTIVQRVLAAESINQARLGAIFAGFLKILPVFIMVIPGVLAFLLFKEDIGDSTKNVLPTMIVKLLPVGLKGLMIAALLAAVMSSIAAALNSVSTLIVYDIMPKIRKNLSDSLKIKLGRFFGVATLVFAVIWSPFIGSLGGIFEVINQLFAIFAPSIVAVFLWGILFKVGTSNASLYTLIIGSLLPFVFFIIEKFVMIHNISNYISSSSGLHINWLRQTYLNFILASLIYFTISFVERGWRTIKIEFNEELLPLQIQSYFKWSMATLIIVLLIIYCIFY